MQKVRDLHGPQELKVFLHSKVIKYEAKEMVGVGQRLWLLTQWTKNSTIELAILGFLNLSL